MESIRDMHFTCSHLIYHEYLIFCGYRDVTIAKMSLCAKMSDLNPFPIPIHYH